MFFRVCGARQNLCVQPYRNPDLDDRIFGCLISVAAVQAEDMRASSLFVLDLNGQHQEWLGSTTTNRHGLQPLTSQLCLAAIRWLSAHTRA